ncbi:glycine zipper 2TM domain-containing protein [Denitrificimonas sp. JX-1]|uniref:Glycine zipper 2TM domain-containing protein n=1 Tax=Denitrificimonas halotolerans TaxID=3098930 RepID=A0ABU5GSJ1_9GAMM|nr:glycine zipper 2TM domain-containing protein [Denitrificimonas sp. JX-1]MDY7219950.1 glycine zipper 2TM domain-containing protein [Denitrificimonas sp. JX-1]
MNKSMLIGGVLGAVAVTAGGAYATYNLMSGPSYAEVVAVKAVKETIKTPRQECREVTVTKRKPIKDENRIVGSAVGAVVGGLLGNQVGGGNGKKIATVAGAVGGGYAGNKTQEHLQQNNTYTTTEQRCRTEYDISEKNAGYDVSYELDGKVRTVRMDEDPGRRLELDDQGRVVISKVIR